MTLDSLLEGSGWVTAAFALLALGLFRVARSERKLILIISAAYLAALVLQGLSHYLSAHSMETMGATLDGLGVFIKGITSIRLIGIAVFAAFLPSVGMQYPRILQDVSVAAGQLVWGLLWLQKNGVNLAGIIATSAVLTAVIGLSLQDTLGNIVGGLAIQLDDSLHVGDWIKLDDITGRVVETRWRYTTVETRNWETVLIPNSLLMKNKFVVLGRRQGRPVQWRRWVWFNVDFRYEPTSVIETAEGSLRAAEIPRVSRDPAPNCVHMDFGESYNRYALRYWLTDLAADDPTDSEVRQHIYSALQRANISLSIPAAAVFLTQETEERKAIKITHQIADRIEALRRVELFRHATPDEMQRLAEHLVFAPYVVGDVMTRQGTPAHWLYIIIEGRADVIVESPGGHTMKLADLGPGNFFGEWGLMTGEPRHASLIARTRVTCYRLSKDAFQELVMSRPQMVEEITHVLAQRRAELDAAVQKMSEQERAEHEHHVHKDILAQIKHYFGLD